MREKLVEARVARGLSQAQVAEELGVSIVSVSRWENGKVAPRQAQVKSLCDVYQSTPQMLGLAHFSLLEQHKADMTQHLSQALQQDLTGKLFKLVWSWTGQHYGDLQSQISAHITGYHQVSGSSAMTRRAALRSMILLPLELCLAMPTAKNVATEEILAQCAAGITAAWYEAKGYDLQTARDAMDIYLPALQTIAQKASPKQRAAAAELAMQCYIIRGTLIRHLEGNEQALKQLQMALPYSDLAASNEQKILTLRTIAATHAFANRQDRAISFGEQALVDLRGGSLQLQSYVYSGLATYQASQGKKKDAIKSLNKAYSTFFAQSPEDIAPAWIDHSHLNLLLNAGETYLHLGDYQAGADELDKIEALPKTCSATGQAEALFYRVNIEVCRDDQLRNMDLCITSWQKSITAAKEIRSQQLLAEAKATHQMMRAAWPTEQRIKDLRDLLQ